MKKLQNQSKVTVLYIIFSLLIITPFKIFAQCKLKISDNGNVIISSNTYFKIPGDLTVGNGISGTLKTNGTNVTVSGELNLNAGSGLYLTNENITFGTININAASTVTYDGTDENVFNWSYGNLIIDGTGTKSVTGDATTPTVCNNLTVNNIGNILKIPENKALTVNNLMTNNANSEAIVLESSALGDGSLISYTTNVNATINRYLTGNRWHYISSPIGGAPITLFNSNNFMWWDASMDWTGTGDFNPWQGYTGTNLENAKGYAYYYYETTIPYQGNINVGDYSVTLHMYNSGNTDYQGWNMIGNPYSSVLDWDVAVSGGAVPTGAENAIYFFDDDDASGSQSNYRYYVPSSGGTYGIGTENANGKIPIGQGFFIKTNTDNVLLNLSKNYRTHAVQEFYKSAGTEYFKLKIENSKWDEAIVRIIDNSTFGFDPNVDARKLFPIDESIPQLYIIGNDNKITAINSIPDIEENTIIKLGMKAQEGEYDISFSDLNFDKYDVYLADNENGEYVNLTAESNYHFYYNGGINENRFYLTFQSQTSEVKNNLSNRIKIYPNPTSKYIHLSNQSETKFESIKINSTNGRICYLNTSPYSVNEIDMSQFSSGIYFIEIHLSDGNIYRNRIILKK